MAVPDALAADLLDGLGAASLAEVRSRRAACQAIEAQLSYVRRLAQGRLDIVLSEIDARRCGTQGERTLVEQLTEALSDRVTAPGNGRPSVGDTSGAIDPALLVSLDRAGPPGLVSAPAAMDDAALGRAAEALAEFEREISGRRQAMFGRIDVLQAEIVRRYQSGQASVDSLLNQ